MTVRRTRQRGVFRRRLLQRALEGSRTVASRRGVARRGGARHGVVECDAVVRIEPGPGAGAGG